MYKEDTEKLGFSLKELAGQLPVSVPFLRKEISRGKLKSKKLGDRVVILRADRDAYVFGEAETEGETADNGDNGEGGN